MDKTTTSSNVVNLDDARIQEIEAPQAFAIPDSDDCILIGSDGEQGYVWLASKMRKRFRVTEIYPGEAQRKTLLRDLDDDELELAAKFSTVEEIIDDLVDTIIACYEECEECDGEECDVS